MFTAKLKCVIHFVYSQHPLAVVRMFTACELGWSQLEYGNHQEHLAIHTETDTYAMYIDT